MTVDECRENIAEDVVYQRPTYLPANATIERVDGRRVYIHLWSGKIVPANPALLTLMKGV